MKKLLTLIILFASLTFAQSDLLSLLSGGAKPVEVTVLSAVGTAMDMTITYTVPANTDSVQIYRGTSTNPTTLITTLYKTTTTYLDSPLTAGTIYFYRLIAKNSVGSSGYSANVSDTALFNTASQQYFDRLPTKIGTDTLAVYATFIDSLNILGYWSRIDEMGILANKTSANALIGLKNKKDATLVSTPTFAVYQGFTGGTGKAINTHLIPDTNLVQFTLNAGSLGMYSRTEDLTTANDMGTNFNGTDQSTIYITSDTYYGRVNGSNWSANIASIHTQGFFCMDRHSATNVGVVKNGAYADKASNAGALCKYSFYVLAQNTENTVAGPSPRQIAFWYIGGSFSAAEHVILNRLVEAMLDGIGAGVE